jgi:arylsulfatase A-like enzyme
MHEMATAALWIALLTGFAEVAILGVRKFALGQTIGLSQHVVWMAPLGYVLLFVPPTLVLAVLAARLRWLRLEHVTGLLAFLAALGLASMFPRLHRLAMLVVALGTGVHAARLVASHREGFRRMISRSLVPLGALASIAAVTMFGALWLRERNALAAVPDARPAAPNVILIILDTVRAASMSLYGYDRPTTPNLERLASRGVVFDRALSTSPWTLPAHGTMFTGRHPHELTANWETPLDGRYPTLAEVLAARGYLTAGFVANPFYGSYEHGLDRGFAHYEDYIVSVGQILNSTSLGSQVFAGRPGFSHNVFRRILNDFEFFGRKKADRLSEDFLDWLGDGRDAPYFAFLNYMDAHVPYTPPDDLAERFGVRPPPPLWHRITGNRSTLTEEQRRAGSYDRNRYDAAIAEIDRALGAMFDTLEQRGALENTLVIITSDHGEHLGENGLYSHANSLYMPNLHVPLMLWHPGEVPQGGMRIREIVSLRSLPATILDLLEIGDAPEIPGQSLSSSWQGGPALSDPVLASVRKGINMSEDIPIARGDLASIVAAEHQYIRNPGSEELYDLSGAMANDRNLSGGARTRELEPRLRAELMQLLPLSDSTSDAGEPRS